MTINVKESFSKQRIFNNIGLKLLSLILAIVFWMVVVNFTDPIVSQTFKNVPVHILNDEIIIENGETLEVLYETDVIPSVIVKAQRSVVQELGNTADYLYATADLNKLSGDRTQIPIEIVTTKYNEKVESIRPTLDNVTVKIETRKTVQLPIYTTTSGTIEEGYVIGNVELAQNQVRVSGPESVINRIGKAVVDVQISGFTENISTLSDVVLLDENGIEIQSNALTLNVENIRVDVEILVTKRVPVFYATIGTPAEGYEATGEVDIYPETVLIAGSKSAIKSVKNVYIPSTELNLTGQTSDLKVVLNLNDYLLENIRLADSNYNGNVTVTVYIEPIIKRTYSIESKAISILNIPAGYSATFADETENVEIMLCGLSQNLEKINLDGLDFKVDLASLSGSTELYDGIYKLPVEVNLPDGVKLYSTVFIDVSLTKLAEIEDTEENE